MRGARLAGDSRRVRAAKVAGLRSACARKASGVMGGMRRSKVAIVLALGLCLGLCEEHHGAQRCDSGNGVFVDEVLPSAVRQDDGEAVEAFHQALHLVAIDKVYRDGDLLAHDGVQENVLKILRRPAHVVTHPSRPRKPRVPLGLPSPERAHGRRNSRPGRHVRPCGSGKELLHHGEFSSDERKDAGRRLAQRLKRP